MKRILKFVIQPFFDTEIKTANGVERWLAVGWQGETLVVWVEAVPVHEGLGHVNDYVVGVMTGNETPPDSEYVGTAQHPTLNGGGPLVVHVYRGSRG